MKSKNLFLKTCTPPIIKYFFSRNSYAYIVWILYLVLAKPKLTVCSLSSPSIFQFLSQQLFSFPGFYEPLLLRHWTPNVISILQIILGCPLSFLPSPSACPGLYSNTQVIFISFECCWPWSECSCIQLHWRHPWGLIL